MKVVLDTNALLISIGSKSKYRPIFDAFLEEKYEIAVSTEILLEYVEVMGQHFRPDTALKLGRLISKSPNTHLTNVSFRWDLITADPDDNKFVDCAISARVQWVVTNDKPFQVLKTIDFPRVDIISIDDFLEVVNSIS